jgi:hypothetical protein
VPRAIRSAIPLLLTAALAAAAACGERQRAPAADTSAAPALPPSAATNDGCPRTGKWELCNVRRRLVDAGLVPQPRDSVRPSFLTVPGAVFAVGGGELQLFLYADSAARARDLARFDTVRAQPRDTTVTWSAPATFIASNNLAAIFLSDSETQIERVKLALTAGLPER